MSFFSYFLILIFSYSHIYLYLCSRNKKNAYELLHEARSMEQGARGREQDGCCQALMFICFR